jgi:glycosyltransferase involved in cell wall biosynthesis
MRTGANIGDSNQKDLFHKHLDISLENENAEFPTISIIVCTFNSASYVNKCLKSILDSDYPKERVEIICVDDGSCDETINVLRKYPVKIISLEEHVGRAKARNLGIERASKDIILFVDSDSEIDPKMLYYHAVHYRDPNCCCVSGRIIQVGESNMVSKCWETMPWIRIQNFDKKLIDTGITWAPSGNLSFRATFIKQILFDEKFRGHGEDVDLGLITARKGAKLLREENALVYHKKKTSLQQQFLDMFSRGRSEITLSAKHAHRIINIAPSFITVSIILIMLTLPISLFNWKSLFIAPVFLSTYVFIDFIAYVAGYKTFGYYGYLSSRLTEKIITWPIFFLWRVAFESGKIYEAIKVGKPKLLIKRFRYTEQTRKRYEVTPHFWALIAALTSSFIYASLL